MTGAQFISIIFSSGSHLSLGQAMQEELLGKLELRTQMKVLPLAFRCGSDPESCVTS